MKAVIAAGGFATRFLPVSKIVPKELLPILGKPIIHRQIMMLLSAGIYEILIVVRHGADLIHSYFERDVALEEHLGLERSTELFNEHEYIRRNAMIAYTHELEIWPYGDAESLLAAKPWLTPGELFYLLWADDIILSRVPAPLQLLDVYKQAKKSVVAVQSAAADGSRYWSSVDLESGKGVIALHQKGKSTGQYAQIGHFLFEYEVFDALSECYPVERGEEFWIGKMLERLVEQSALHGCEIEGQWLAAGDFQRYLAANALAKDYLEGRNA